MKSFLAFILFITTGSTVFAVDLCWKFEPRDKGSQIKSLTLRAPDKGKKTVWNLKAISLDGHTFRGQVSCQKNSPVNEWKCSRSDGGGGFEILQTGQAARFQTKFFEFGDSGDKKGELLSLQADENDPWVFRGEVKNCGKPLIGAPPL